jgi:hypothetical protein
VGGFGQALAQSREAKWRMATPDPPRPAWSVNQRGTANNRFNLTVGSRRQVKRALGEDEEYELSGSNFRILATNQVVKIDSGIVHNIRSKRIPSPGVFEYATHIATRKKSNWGQVLQSSNDGKGGIGTY